MYVLIRKIGAAWAPPPRLSPASSHPMEFLWVRFPETSDAVVSVAHLVSRTTTFPHHEITHENYKRSTDYFLPKERLLQYVWADYSYAKNSGLLGLVANMVLTGSIKALTLPQFRLRASRTIKTSPRQFGRYSCHKSFRHFTFTSPTCRERPTSDAINYRL